MPNSFIKQMSEKILQSLQENDELKAQLEKDIQDYKNNKNDKGDATDEI